MFSKKNTNDEQDQQSAIDKNLKMMSISGVVLIVLFLYTVTKSENVIHNSSYYIGVGFLFILLILTFALQKYKDKIRSKVPKNRFNTELLNARENQKKKESINSENQNKSTNSNTDINNDIEAIESNVTFEDVAGISDVKEELQEIVDFLNNPKKYQKYGVSLPKGVLLVGPPGVGKTLIAKAVAGVAGVPFFYQSGASFVHIYVGMGAKRVRELFTKARAKAPSIIFIDEIDAVGKMRGIGGNDEREATLNELLTQMDGFIDSGVMVIAATNKIDVLDDALLRAGRFDRRVFLELPSKNDRIDILKLYLKDTKHNFDLEKLSLDTSGFSSAAIATLINESLLCMIKRGGTSILEEDIAISKQKVQFGKKQQNILSPNEKDILATYQAGKAFITQEKVLLLESGVSSKILVYPSKTELKNEIKRYLAGGIALEIIKGETHIVFEDEIKEAYKIAHKMVEVYKMENSQEKIIEEVKKDLKEVLEQNIEKIKELRDILIKEEVVVF